MHMYVELHPSWTVETGQSLTKHNTEGALGYVFAEPAL